jgi:hypothetical protein
LQPADGYPPEGRNRITHRLEHAPHLLVAAFPQFHFHGGHVAPAIGAQHAGPGGGGAAPEERYPGAQPLQGFLIRNAVDLREVELGHAVARMGEGVGEGPVVGEEEQALALRIQAPHRVQAGDGGGALAQLRLEGREQQFHHGVSGVGIRPGYHAAAGLVEGQVEALHVAGEGPPLHRNGVALPVHPTAGSGNHLAVDGDLTRGDQLLGVSPRSDAGGGEDFCQTFLHSGFRAAAGGAERSR